MSRSLRMISRSALLLSITVASHSVIAAGALTFESLDKNSDGKLSLDEASANDKLFAAFKSLDGNKDGILTREEFAAYKT